jgi:acetyltransferase-like isoleucine patch superfamily enzyme
MKTLLESVIRLRNPNFRFHPQLNMGAIFSFVWQQVFNLIRGLKWFFYFKNPQMSLVGRKVRLTNTPRIRFGKFLKLGDGVELSALGSEGIRLGNNVGIGAYSRLVVSTTLDNPGAFIRIGDQVGIGEFAYLGGAGGLEIGNECIVGQYFSCHPENHIAEELGVSIRLQGVSRKGIFIGHNCWIGSKVTILDGVSLGDGCIVAAGAVVTKSFPSNSVIGGVPAKLLKTRT